MRLQRGFTIAETLMAAALLAVSADAMIGGVSTQLESRRIEQARQEITSIESAVEAYRGRHRELPASLAELGTALNLIDPWGRPYEYVNFELRGTSGQRTLDRLPINSDYDLYSRGADGRTSTNLKNEESRDDVVRGRDGAFIGLASEF
jgi:general secretion pathway protein G